MVVTERRFLRSTVERALRSRLGLRSLRYDLLYKKTAAPQHNKLFSSSAGERLVVEQGLKHRAEASITVRRIWY
jgi:hypothetical protein